MRLVQVRPQEQKTRLPGRERIGNTGTGTRGCPTSFKPFENCVRQPRSFFVLLLQQMQGVQQHYGRQERCGRGKERHGIARSSRRRRPAVNSRKALQNHGTDRGQARQTEFVSCDRSILRTRRHAFFRMELDEQNRRGHQQNNAAATYTKRDSRFCESPNTRRRSRNAIRPASSEQLNTLLPDYLVPIQYNPEAMALIADIGNQSFAISIHIPPSVS